MTNDYNKETIFPWQMVEDLIRILKSKHVNFATYADFNVKRVHPKLDIPAYVLEYCTFKSQNGLSLGLPFHLAEIVIKQGLRKMGLLVYDYKSKSIVPSKTQSTVVFQHDADRQPYKTIDMMELEHKNGVCSSSYFFKDRNMWDDDIEAYDLDVLRLQELERDGFEIGYHLNAYERADYDLGKTFKIIGDDIEWFKERFDLRTFVPHGGVAGPNGINNEYIPYTGVLRDYTWSYNGLGLLADYKWSDGLVFLESLVDPREAAHHIKAGQRFIYLMHPQYYGDQLMENWESLPVSGESWWRKMWQL